MQDLVRKAAYRLSRTVREVYFSFFPKRDFLKNLERRPRFITIETVNICNANCTFCGYQFQERPKKIMDEAVFRKALGDFVEMGGGDLGLSVVVGDPLLDPRFVERIKAARLFPQIGKIGTTTNVLQLHKVGSEKLLTSGITAICVSTSGFDPEMYKRVFRSDRFEKMKANLLDLLRTNHRLGKPAEITVSLRIDKPVGEVLSYPGFNEVRELADLVETNAYFDNWSGRITPGLLTGNMKIRPNKLLFMKKKTPCSQLYSGLGVLSDGTVTACACRDLNGDSDLVLGHILLKSLREMWESETLEKLRSEWFSGERIPKICSDCTIYNPYTYLMLEEVRGKMLDGMRVESA